MANNLKCSWPGGLEDQIPLLLNGRLGASSESTFRDHVRGCAYCQKEFEILTNIRSVIMADTPPVDARLVAEAVRVKRAKGSKSSRVKIAGGLTVVVAILLSISYQFGRTADSADEVALSSWGRALGAMENGGNFLDEEPKFLLVLSDSLADEWSLAEQGVLESQ